jgi:outer membrane protein
MKYIFVAFSCLLLTIGILEAAKEQKIGYVDTEYILKNYRTAMDAQRALETELGKYKKNADSLKILYDNAQIEFEGQKLMFSEQGKQAKMIEISRFKKDYDDYVTEIWGKGGKIELKNRELITPIVQQIQTTVQQIASKDGFSLVFDASESKIVYAQTGLDLTDIVLNELNKEYAPSIAPPPNAEKEIAVAVFPIFEQDQEAQEEHIGGDVRSAINDIIKSFPQTRLISNTDVNNTLLTRNISLTSQVSDDDAYSIGRMLQADYIVIGTVTKQGKKISFTVKASDPLNSKVIYQGSGDAPRIEELKQSLGNQLQQAIKKIREK